MKMEILLCSIRKTLAGDGGEGDLVFPYYSGLASIFSSLCIHKALLVSVTHTCLYGKQKFGFKIMRTQFSPQMLFYFLNERTIFSSMKGQSLSDIEY